MMSPVFSKKLVKKAIAKRLATLDILLGKEPLDYEEILGVKPITKSLDEPWAFSNSDGQQRCWCGSYNCKVNKCE